MWRWHNAAVLRLDRKSTNLSAINMGSCLHACVHTLTPFHLRFDTDCTVGHCLVGGSSDGSIMRIKKERRQIQTENNCTDPIKTSQQCWCCYIDWCSNKFPGQLRDLVPGLGLSWGLLPLGQNTSTRRPPKQILEPPRMTPVHVEEEQLDSKLLWGDPAHHPDQRVTWHPMQQTHLGRLHPWSHSIHHDPKLSFFFTTARPWDEILKHPPPEFSTDFLVATKAS